MRRVATGVRSYVVRLYAAYEAFNRDGGYHLAAAAAYFFGLSLFPMLSVGIMTLGWFLRSTHAGQDARLLILDQVEDHASRVVAEQVRQLMEQIQSGSSQGGLFGLAMLCLTALAGFAELQQAFDRIWNVPVPERPGIRSFLRQVLLERAAAFLMLMLTGTLVLAAFFFSTVMSTAQGWAERLNVATPALFWTTSQALISPAVNVLAFTLVYRWLPKARVPWRDAFHGAVLVAAAWELGRHALAAILIGTHYSTAYGIVGAFISLLAWCYYGCLLLLLGGEFVASLGRERWTGRPPEEMLKSIFRTTDEAVA